MKKKILSFTLLSALLFSPISASADHYGLGTAWAAIAVAEQHGIAGTATRMKTKAAAKRAAKAACRGRGGSDCVVEVVTQGACLAVAESKDRTGTALGFMEDSKTKSAAAKKAVQYCQAETGGSACRVLAAACSNK